MNNLILYVDNYAAIGGKSYAVDTFSCNYPIRQNGTTLSITCTNGSDIITSTDDLTELLGGDIQNNNVPLYKWLGTFLPALIEIRNLNSATEAVLTHNFAGASGTYDFSTIDIFGQPTVEQTYAMDSTAGFPTPVNVITKYGSVDVEVNTTPIPLGSEPILVNFNADFIQSALNIQYSDNELS